MSKIKISALGGLAENGKNMFVVEVDDRIFILDAGLKYPEVDLYGIDAIIPNIDYLIKNKDRIEGIFLSHGHEDHIGALPYLLQNIKTRVYGTNFTICLIENLLVKNNMDVSKYKLFKISTNKVYTFGKVEVSFFFTTHSVPESAGIVISTNDGAIVFAPDFNFHTPANNSYHTDFDKITALGSKNVLVALTESIGISEADRATNDVIFEHTINSVLISAKSRVFVGLYSTDLSRIQKILDLSVKNNYKVVIMTNHNDRLIHTALKNHYLSISDDYYIDYKNYKEEKCDKVVVITTGIKLQPYKTLTKIATHYNKTFTMNEDDQVIIVSDPIPGTDKGAMRALDAICATNAKVTLVDNKKLRTSHATAEDLVMFYQMIKPKYIIPIVGEYRHISKHVHLLLAQGFADKQIICMENGKAAVFEDGIYTKKEHINTGSLLVDGSLMGSVNEEVVKERNQLADEGAVIIISNLDMLKRTYANQPVVYIKGMAITGSLDEYRNNIIEMVKKHIDAAFRKPKFNLDNLTTIVETEVSRMTYRIYKRKPIVIPVFVKQTK